MVKLLLLLLSAGKLGKLLTTGGTMLLSVAAYALVFGWRYAAGFVALIFVHEMGHWLAARQRGLKVGAPTFIPFVGAWIELKDQPHDAETEAWIGFAGPLLSLPSSAAGLVAGSGAAAGDFIDRSPYCRNPAPLRGRPSEDIQDCITLSEG